jgi:hypothetical protein
MTRWEFGFHSTSRYTSAISQHQSPEACLSFSPLTREQGMPDARCTRGLVCNCTSKKRTRAYRAAENIRHSLRNGFTAYLALTPEYRALLASVALRNPALRPGRAFVPPQDLTPTTEASGPHDFAVRFGTARLARSKDRSRSLSRPAIPIRARCCRVHRNPVPTFGDDGQRPFLGDRMT